MSDRENVGEADRTFVVARVGTSRYCVSVGHVREVVTEATVTPVPGSPEGVPGVINVRGRVMALVDLRHVLGEACDDEGGGATALVLDSEVAPDLAMRVDEVIDVLALSEVELQPAPSFGLGRSGAWAAAVVELPSGLSVVLELAELLASVGVGALSAGGSPTEVSA